jgi:hypothetical protein
LTRLCRHDYVGQRFNCNFVSCCLCVMLSSPAAASPASHPVEAGWRLAFTTRPPSNLTILFPELRPSGRCAMAMPASPWRRRQRAVILEQGELAAPPFHLGAPWASGRVAAPHLGGMDSPGWLAQAVLLPSWDARRGDALLAQLAAARVGAIFWAPTPALPRRGDASCFVCLPHRPGRHG